MNETYYLAYLHTLWLNHSDFFEIFENSDISPKYVFENMSEELLVKYISSADKREKILEKYKKINIVKLQKILTSLKVQIITVQDTDFPESLKQIPHCPYLLYVRGNLPKWDAFGVVGSRSISSYGKKCIAKLIPDLTKVFTIVSGGALGCDTEAHKVAMQSWGKTIIVTGTGIEQTYPIKNTAVFEEIIEKDAGAIVSIFPLGEEPMPYNFPIRNEIVVGFSKGVLVVEAKEKSGSLITAGLCLDMWRDLFAVPWDITLPGSSGTNMLIKQGSAKCVTESMDILEEYNLLVKSSAHKPQLPLLDGVESQLYMALTQEECTVNFLVEKLQIHTGEVMWKLALLELKGLVKKNITWKYTLT